MPDDTRHWAQRRPGAEHRLSKFTHGATRLDKSADRDGRSLLPEHIAVLRHATELQIGNNKARDMPKLKRVALWCRNPFVESKLRRKKKDRFAPRHGETDPKSSETPRTDNPQPVTTKHFILDFIATVKLPQHGGEGDGGWKKQIAKVVIHFFSRPRIALRGSHPPFRR